jgi:hypothetical protein
LRRRRIRPSQVNARSLSDLASASDIDPFELLLHLAIAEQIGEGHFVESGNERAAATIQRHLERASRGEDAIEGIAIDNGQVEATAQAASLLATDRAALSALEQDDRGVAGQASPEMFEPRDATAPDAYRKKVGKLVDSLLEKPGHRTDVHEPGLVELFARSLETVQATITRLKLAAQPPDLLITIAHYAITTQLPILRSRNSRMAAPMSAACVSSAKWPVS